MICAHPRGRSRRPRAAKVRPCPSRRSTPSWHRPRCCHLLHTTIRLPHSDGLLTSLPTPTHALRLGLLRAGMQAKRVCDAARRRSSINPPSDAWSGTRYDRRADSLTLCVAGEDASPASPASAARHAAAACGAEAPTCSANAASWPSTCTVGKSRCLLRRCTACQE